jgi:hypothetical protein
MLIAANDRTALQPVLVIFINVNELDVKVNLFVMSLLPLDAHHLVNRISDVEDLKVLPELIGFDLSEVEQILNDEIHELSGVLLNYSAFIQRFKDVHAAFVGVRVLYFRIKLLELLLQLVVHRRFLNILGNY